MRQPGDRAPAPGPLALVQDLINTADLECGLDRLRTPDNLDVFCIDHGIGEVAAGPADLDAARDLREALRAACRVHAGRPAPEPPVPPAVRARLDQAPLVLMLGGGGPPRAVPASGLAGVGLLVAHVAAAILAAVADGSWHRLKACESDLCQWVYYDHSPAGRGRWCTMSICGARAKMRAYRARR